jgi:hypothetical protein
LNHSCLGDLDWSVGGNKICGISNKICGISNKICGILNKICRISNTTGGMMDAPVVFFI